MAKIADHAWDGLPTDSPVVLNGGLNIALGGGGTSQIQGRRDSSVGSIRRDEPDWDIKTDGEKYLDSLGESPLGILCWNPFSYLGLASRHGH